MLSPTQQIFEFDGYRVDPAKRQLTRWNEPIPLAPKAFDVLLLFVRNSGQVLDKNELMKRLWPDSFVEEANLNVHVSALRKAFGENAQNSRYISTIPGRGYRFNAEFAELVQDSEEIIVREKTISRVVVAEEITNGKVVEDTSVAVSARSREAKPWGSSFQRPVLLAGAVALLIVLAAVVYFKRKPETGGPPGTSRTAVKSLAVLPFKSLDERDEHLGVGMADTLITRLSGLRLLTVRPTSAILPYAATDKQSVAIGRDLGVESVLEGSIQREGEHMRVTVRLISVQDNQMLWGGQYDEQFTGILNVQDAISQRVTDSLALKLTEDQRKYLAKRHTNDTEAYSLYLKGRHFWNKRTADGLKRAIEFFRKAIDEDPQYALAFAGLADAYSMLGEHTGRAPKEYRPQAKAAAMKALELDDSLAEAHASLAYLRMRDWDWAGVEVEFKRALELDPNYATARQWYSTFLELTGRPEEAIAEAVRAQELDPLSPIVNESLGARLFFARKYDRAVEQLKTTLEIDQNFAQARHTLGDTYLQMGKSAEALSELQRSRQLDNNPWVMASLGYAYAVTGRKSEALRILDELKERSQQSRVPPEEVARIYLGLGERDQALGLLDKAYEEHSDHLAFVKMDPAWSPLVSNPKFINILRRIGLQPSK